MVAGIPEVLLVCETRLDSQNQCIWRFSIETLSGDPVIEASDHEPCDANRLALLSVVRGLEALEGPSSVTMMCSSSYVIHGLRSGLAKWRESEYRWDYYGRLVPVPNGDLWRRVDRALGIHNVSTCWFSASFQACGPGSQGMPVTSPAPLDRIRTWLAGQITSVRPEIAVA